MIRNHFEGILSRVTSRRFRTIRTVIFLIAGKLDFCLPGSILEWQL